MQLTNIIYLNLEKKIITHIFTVKLLTVNKIVTFHIAYCPLPQPITAQNKTHMDF